MDIKTAISQALATAKVTGVRYAPAYPPENIGDYFPCLVGYTTGGTWSTVTSGFNQCLFNIVLELHIARQGDLPHEVEKAMGYSDSIPAALLADQTLHDTVSHFESVSYTFGVLDYGETKTLGFKFILEGVKIH